uniref:Ribosomal protein L11 n=1 Tax=Malawimonas californiana TaxID=221722 RepID=A0A0B5GMU9_MALCL|nr:ribosomal protein L11 [Malawimonas californiana]AJF22873.1 ribosomal protein L11 [Malawimonas californiana]
MIKSFKEKFKLTILANNASPTPPVGPMLGQRGLNIMEFSKNFNNQTKDIKDEVPIPIDVTVQKNKTFSIKLKKPVNSFFLKRGSNIESGSSEPKNSIVSTMKVGMLYEIINTNNPNLDENDKINKCKSLIATAKSMGIEIIE